MTTHVEYWGVGAATSANLPFAHGTISVHLLADWAPSLPPAVATSFLGWPQHLTEVATLGSVAYLALTEGAGHSERQWKAVLSWMLGVAGARQFLALEGYEWIAPLSAFYPDLVQPVNTLWHPSFPRTTLSAVRAVGNTSRLRPDYVALRPSMSGSGFDWTIIEAKGTSECLTNRALCYPSWRNQVRNVTLSLDGVPLNVSRHVVVATRSNPNARTSKTRRLQIRAWNSDEDLMPPPPEAAVDVVYASLFSLCSNLNLRSNARALAYAITARVTPSQSIRVDQLQQLEQDADAELERLGSQPLDRSYRWSSAYWSLRIPDLATKVEISGPIVSLLRRLGRIIKTDEALAAIHETERELHSWEFSSEDDGVGGVIVRLPQGLVITAQPSRDV